MPAASEGGSANPSQHTRRAPAKHAGDAGGISSERHPCIRGPLISVDGITGIGKTYLTLRAVEALDNKPVLLEEFSRRIDGGPGLGKALLRALIEASAGDPFLRGGAPLAETMLLLAIKRHDLDTALPALSSGQTVVEGRSVDTTAVCQALQLHPHDGDTALETAVALRDFAASYRPLPDLTILVTDEASEAVTRAQRRDKCIFTSEQVTFMQDACTLYERLAATDPTRYRVLDRRNVDEYEAADLIERWIQDAGTGLSCLREPWQNRQAPCMCCGSGTAQA
ncbi:MULTISPECIES: dTMP kinase [Micromonospora]|uniref:dTMP kinase n=1 Tax=Micromonospora TaxID=1873 RepID=UPI0009E356A8|nr:MULTISPECIES: thymidylate kinase [unclassified Micromonospora]MDG4756185.1 hypothetical protein [Micromonospora sp. WMMD718]